MQREQQIRKHIRKINHEMTCYKGVIVSSICRYDYYS